METILSLLQPSFDNYPDKPALKEKVGSRWQSTSYGTLGADSDAVAAGLQTRGLRSGGQAALFAPSSPRWVTAYLGILKAGGVAVPIDKELKAAELRHVLSDCDATFLFTTRELLETVLDVVEELPALKGIVLLDGRGGPRAALEQATAAVGALVEEWHRLVNTLDLPPEQVATLEGLANKAHRSLVGAVSPPESSAENDLFSSGTRLRQVLEKEGRLVSLRALQASHPPEPAPLLPGDPAVILYTSGTTGRSKGAVLSHGNITSNLRGLPGLFGLDQSIATLSFLPINHVFEQVCGILLPLSLGGTVNFAESLKRLGDNLREVRPTFFLGVPAVYRLFLDRIKKGIEAKPSSRLLYALPLARSLVASRVRKAFGEQTIFVSGGAALDPEIAKAFQDLGFRFFQGYGITETSPVISLERPGKTRLGTVGLPLDGVEVRIDTPNEEGVGEILVRGPNVMLGYYKNPQSTAEVLKEGWYFTGDLGRIERGGFLSICGRVKNLIVTPNGKNVYPEEVENELLKSPFIAEAMVYGHRIDRTAEEVHAQIYPDQEALDAYGREQGLHPMRQEDVERLIRREVLRAGEALADYKRVRKFTLREDEFPKTTTRKIKRFAVEAQIPAGGS